eukprot:359336-Chlamydomonas_euryale.AAC.2
MPDSLGNGSGWLREVSTGLREVSGLLPDVCSPEEGAWLPNGCFGTVRSVDSWSCSTGWLPRSVGHPGCVESSHFRFHVDLSATPCSKINKVNIVVNIPDRKTAVHRAHSLHFYNAPWACSLRFCNAPNCTSMPGWKRPHLAVRAHALASLRRSPPSMHPPAQRCMDPAWTRA